MVIHPQQSEEFNFTEHKVVREAYKWGSYGKYCDASLRIRTLSTLSTNHIYNILRTQRLEEEVKMVFIRELCFRCVTTWEG